MRGRVWVALTILVVLLGAGFRPAAAVSSGGGAALVQKEPPPQECPPTIAYGQIVRCSIDLPTEVDRYTLQAGAGDVLLARMGYEREGPDPQLQLFDPQGELLCEAAQDNAHPGDDAVDLICSLPAAGPYTLTAADLGGDEAGTYHLSLQRLTNVTATLSFGQAVTGTLPSGAGTVAHTVQAAGGDLLLARMGYEREGPDPHLRLFDPQGALLCDARQDNADPGDDAVELICALPAAGLYTLVGADLNGDEAGAYYLSLQRLTNTAATLSFGQAVTGTLPSGAGTVAHTVQAAGGDLLLARMGYEREGPDPHLRLFDPQGALLCEARQDNAHPGDDAVELICPLPAAGLYTLVGADLNGDEAGAYYLSLQRLTNTAATLAFGQKAEGTLPSGAGTVAYTLQAGEGDLLLARMGYEREGPDPHLRLFDPQGALLCDARQDNADPGDDAVELICALPAAGLYTLVGDDLDGDEAGAYHLSLQRLNNRIGRLSRSGTIAGALESVADTDAYTFRALAGDFVLARLRYEEAGVDPQLRLFDPQGELLCQAVQENADMAQGTAAFTCTLSTGGVHTLVVADLGGDEFAPYKLSLQGLDTRMLRRALRTPLEISTDPRVIGTNLVLAALLTVLFSLTSTVFNDTLQEHEQAVQEGWLGRWIARLQRWLRPRRTPGAPGKRRAAYLTLGGFLLLTALLACFLDPSFEPLSWAGVGLFLSLLLSVSVVNLVYEGAQVVAARRFNLAAVLRIYPAGLLVALLCVLFSRWIGFVPGYLYGIPGGYALGASVSLSRRREAAISAAPLAGTLLLALLAWGVTIPLSWLLQAGDLGPLRGLLRGPVGAVEGVLLLTFFVGLEVVFLELFPLGPTHGTALFRWSKAVWVLVFVPVTFLAAHTLFTPESIALEAAKSHSLRLLIGLLALYSALTVLFWYLYELRQLRRAIHCPACGYRGEAGARFCSRCGRELRGRRVPLRTLVMVVVLGVLWLAVLVALLLVQAG